MKVVPNAGSNDKAEEFAKIVMKFPEYPRLSEQLSAFQWDSIKLVGWLVHPAS